MPRPCQFRSAEPSRGVTIWRVTPLWARDKSFTWVMSASSPTLAIALKEPRSRPNFHLGDKQPSQPQRYARIAHHHFFARALTGAARCRRRQVCRNYSEALGSFGVLYHEHHVPKSAEPLGTPSPAQRAGAGGQSRHGTGGGGTPTHPAAARPQRRHGRGSGGSGWGAAARRPKQRTAARGNARGAGAGGTRGAARAARGASARTRRRDEDGLPTRRAANDGHPRNRRRRAPKRGDARGGAGAEAGAGADGGRRPARRSDCAGPHPPRARGRGEGDGKPRGRGEGWGRRTTTNGL